MLRNGLFTCTRFNTNLFNFSFSDYIFLYLECVIQISRHKYIAFDDPVPYPTSLHCMHMRMALHYVFLSFASISLLFICGGRLLYEQYYGEQKCEMTYMYLYPQYQVDRN